MLRHKLATAWPFALATQGSKWNFCHCSCMKAASKLATLVSGAASAHEQKSRRKAFPGPSKAEIKHVRQIQEPPADPDILHHREAELVPTETDQTTAPGKKLSKRDRR